MDHYLAMLKLVNSDSVAAMFTDSAEMYQAAAPPIRGRDAIRAFLKPFDGHAHVDSVSATTIALNVYGDAAYQWANYRQVARVGGGAAESFDGRFVVEWARGAGGNWKIRRLLMQPAH
jgi:ketosteroid isomerase-like protein